MGILSFSTIALILSFWIYSRKHNKGILSLGVFFLVTSFLSYYPRYFYNTSSLESFFLVQKSVIENDYEYVFLFIFFSYLMFIVGYVLRDKLRAHRIKTINDYLVGSRTRLVVFSLGITVVILNTMSIDLRMDDLSSGSKRVFDGKYFLVPFYKLYYIKIQELFTAKSASYRYFLFFILFLLSIIELSKESILQFLLLIVLVRHYYIKPATIKFFIFSILVVICLVVIFPFIKYGLEYKDFEIVPADLYAMLVSRYYHIHSFMFLVDYTQQNGFEPLITIKSFLSSLIPSIIWADKPLSLGYQFSSITGSNTSAAISLHGEVYWGYGWASMPLFIMMGYFFSSVDSWVNTNRHSVLTVIIFGIFMFNVFMLHDGNIAHRVIITLLQLSPFLLLKFLYAKQ